MSSSPLTLNSNYMLKTPSSNSLPPGFIALVLTSPLSSRSIYPTTYLTLPACCLIDISNLTWPTQSSLSPYPTPLPCPSSLDPILSSLKKWHHHLRSCSGQKLMSQTWWFSCPQYLVFTSSPNSVGLTSKIYSKSISLSLCYCHQEFWFGSGLIKVWSVRWFWWTVCFWPAVR